MKITFLETDVLGSDVDLSIFDELGEVKKFPLSDPLEDAKRIGGADIVIANKVPMNEATLANAANLKLICLTSTGTNKVDFPYVNQRGIKVANVKGYSTESVVQHTFSLFFYLFEKMHDYDRFVKSGEYIKKDIFCHFEPKFHELYGRTWGIIGLGAIGRRVAEVARLFGCRILYYSASGKNNTDDYKRVGFDTLLKESDIISIHAPLNHVTNNLISFREFELMRSDAILLNLGRGPIVNQEALTQALLSDRIGGAGLDVLEHEPMEPNNPLLQIQDSTKLVITPHIAWATVEARNRCAREVAQNIMAFQRGEERNIVRE